MLKNIFISSLFLLSTAITFAQQSINSQKSEVTFEVSNMGYKTVKGNFSGMQGDIHFDVNNLNHSHFDVCIDVASIDTDNKMRDNHLRAASYFDVKDYPTICFQSEKIIKINKGYRAEGTLTMKGVKKKTQLEFTYINNQFQSTLLLDRTNFDVGPNGKFMVGKEITIHIRCSLKK